MLEQKEGYAKLLLEYQVSSARPEESKSDPAEPVDTWKSEIPNRNCAYRLMYNPSFFLVYFSVFALSTFLFCYKITKYGWGKTNNVPYWYWALDWGVIALITFTVVLRAASTSSWKKYFHSKMNIFDIIVVIICVTSQVLWIILPNEDFKEDNGTVDFFMIGVRYGSRFLSIMVGLSNQRIHIRNLRSASEKIIFCASGEYATDPKMSMQIVDDHAVFRSPDGSVQ